jgi:hypothetical protein
MRSRILGRNELQTVLTPTPASIRNPTRIDTEPNAHRLGSSGTSAASDQQRRCCASVIPKRNNRMAESLNKVMRRALVAFKNLEQRYS